MPVTTKLIRKKADGISNIPPSNLEKIFPNGDRRTPLFIPMRENFGEIPLKGAETMTARRWKTIIKKQTIQNGTYRKSFDSVITTLADILAIRDKALEQFREEGEIVMIKKTSDRGAVNMVQNPLLTTFDTYNKTALTYWRDLGLTPKGLKAIDEQAMKEQKVSKLDEVLTEIE